MRIKRRAREGLKRSKGRIRFGRILCGSLAGWSETFRRRESLVEKRVSSLCFT